MSPVFWLVVAAVVVVGFALAWWSSGRARGAGRGGESGRQATENQALRQHRPADPGGWNGGAGGI